MAGWLTIKQAAERLQVSTRWLNERMDDGRIRVFRDGQIVRISEVELDAYLERHSTPAPPATQQTSPADDPPQPVDDEALATVLDRGSVVTLHDAVSTRSRSRAAGGVR